MKRFFCGTIITAFVLQVVPLGWSARAQERIVSLQEAHLQATKEPGATLANATGPFAGLTHSAWTHSDGAPGSISSLAQTKDGFLWIGTSLGLYRFDGVRFDAYPFSAQQASLPTEDVQSIAADFNGGLWVGLRKASVVHLLVDGTAVEYDRNSGLNSETLDHITVRNDRSVWVQAGGRLLTLQDQQWVDYGLQHGLGTGAVFSVFFDKHDAIWVAQDHRLMTLPKGANTFVLVPSSVFFVSSMAEDKEGKLWLADAWRSVIPLRAASHNSTVRLQGRARLLFDNRDDLWIAEDFFGLSRVSYTPATRSTGVRIEHHNSMPDLTSPQIGAMIQDRDGNIWIGTALGLDRYQPVSFQQFSAAPVNYYPSMVGARDGSVWIDSNGEPLMRWKDASVTGYGQFVTYGPLATRRDGEVCFVDARANELQCYGPSHAIYTVLDKRIEYAPALSLLEDTDGALLVSFENKGIWRYDGTWTRITSPTLPATSPLSMYLDGTGRLWLGYPGSLLAVRSEDGFHVLTMPTGQWDNTLAIAEGAGTMWIAGSSGLAFWNGHRLQRVQGTDGERFKGTSGVVFDRRGNLWLNSGKGAIRITAGNVTRILSDQQFSVPFDEYTERDGLTGLPTQNKPTPSLIADAHGILWFATAGHLTSLDPQAVAENHEHFSVLVENIQLDGRTILPPTRGGKSVEGSAAATHSLAISFAALDLNSPERMRYRYRLVGEDATWQEGGSRREATYTRLPPGKYTFLLSASRNEGNWVLSDTPIQFDILPAFYQTLWFDIAVGLSCCLAILMVIHLRIKQIGAAIRQRSEVRADERVRIARDLHDTLLQGVQGLTLRFSAAARQLPPGSGVRESLETALELADRLILEGRDRVSRLRREQLSLNDLTVGFQAIVLELDFEKRVTFQLDLGDNLTEVQPDVLREVFYIGREALSNALQHAHASKVSVSLKNTPKALVLHVMDDGCGYDVSSDQRTSSAQHWGVAGMRERARNIRARFECLSSPTTGTEVIVVVPAHALGARSFRSS